MKVRYDFAVAQENFLCDCYSSVVLLFFPSAPMRTVFCLYPAGIFAVLCFAEKWKYFSAAPVRLYLCPPP